MARPRASDHESKRSDILERAAALFAEYGYDRTSLVMLAQACGMSKALLYHYYTDKSELLFDIIRTHLEHLLAVTEAVERQVSPDHPGITCSGWPRRCWTPIARPTTAITSRSDRCICCRKRNRTR